MAWSAIHSAFPNKEGSVNFSWIYDRVYLSMNLFFVCFEIIFLLEINSSNEGLILRSRSLISGLFRTGSVCEDGPPSVEEILELHACSCGRKHGGDVGLAAPAAATRESRLNRLSLPLRGGRGPLGLSLHTNQPWVVITTLSRAAGLAN